MLARQQRCFLTNTWNSVWKIYCPRGPVLGKNTEGIWLLCWEAPLSTMLLLDTPLVSVLWFKRHSLSKWARSKGREGETLASPGWMCTMGTVNRMYKSRDSVDSQVPWSWSQDRKSQTGPMEGTFRSIIYASQFTLKWETWTWESVSLDQGLMVTAGCLFSGLGLFHIATCC